MSQDNLPTILEGDVFAALRSFILTLVNCEVIRGQTNRVPMPKGDFVMMTPAYMAQLETNVATYRDIPNLGFQDIRRAARFDIQIDSYGAAACDRATTLSMMMRSEYACQAFAAINPEIQPLYADDPRQMPLITGEEQYLERWTFTAAIQFNPVISIPQEFAERITPNLNPLS